MEPHSILVMMPTSATLVDKGTTLYLGHLRPLAAPGMCDLATACSYGEEASFVGQGKTTCLWSVSKRRGQERAQQGQGPELTSLGPRDDWLGVALRLALEINSLTFNDHSVLRSHSKLRKSWG
jgi:hypothetical protein